MLFIDPTLIGRKFYTVDAKTVYTCRGVLIMGTALLIGEYNDPQAKCSRLATCKLADCKFPDVPGTPSPLLPT
jgi:hypothetical protein